VPAFTIAIEQVAGRPVQVARDKKRDRPTNAHHRVAHVSHASLLSMETGGSLERTLALGSMVSPWPTSFDQV
jgi:hypothetical protein